MSIHAVLVSLDRYSIEDARIEALDNPGHPVALDDCPGLARAVLRIAQTLGRGETSCADCDTPVGIVDTNKGTVSVPLGVLTNGTILCQTHLTVPSTTLFRHGQCRVCGHLRGDHEELDAGRWTCDDDCDEDLSGYCHLDRLQPQPQP